MSQTTGINLEKRGGRRPMYYFLQTTGILPAGSHSDPRPDELPPPPHTHTSHAPPSRSSRPPRSMIMYGMFFQQTSQTPDENKIKGTTHAPVQRNQHCPELGPDGANVPHDRLRHRLVQRADRRQQDLVVVHHRGPRGLRGRRRPVGILDRGRTFRRR